MIQYIDAKPAGFLFLRIEGSEFAKDAAFTAIWVKQ